MLIAIGPRILALCVVGAGMILSGTLGCSQVHVADTAPAAGPASRYVFCYFTGNGEDGLHLALSDDGYHFTALHDGKSYLAPTVGESKLMRDPCILLGPDGVTAWSGPIRGPASPSAIHRATT